MDTKPDEGIPAPSRLDLRAEVLTHDQFPVGEFRDGTLVVNLGWCRLAGLSIRVEDDPAFDNHRSGVALERLVEPRP
jgi:hypothetical protein